MGLALVSFSLAFALIAIVAAASWPRRPLAAALVWATGPLALLLCFADAPGPVPAILGLMIMFFPLRALDAARQEQRRGRLEYLRWVLDITQVPARDERPPPPR